MTLQILSRPWMSKLKSEALTNRGHPGCAIVRLHPAGRYPSALQRGHEPSAASELSTRLHVSTANQGLHKKKSKDSALLRLRVEYTVAPRKCNRLLTAAIKRSNSRQLTGC